MTDYLGMGVRGLREFLDVHYAGPWREVEARISETGWPSLSHRIQPHVLTVARRYLEGTGELVTVHHETLGGRTVDLVATGNTHRRATKVEAAIRRKAMLYGRYLSWAVGPLSDDYPSGVVGVAGERVLRAAVRSGLNGLAPVHSPGDVRHLLDLRLKGGSFDDAAFLNVTDDGRIQAILLALEMKNVRRWLYPDDPELHKFLYRAAYLQRERPTALICPVLVCRRRNAKTWKMAKDLGFYAIQTRLHYVLQSSRIEVRKLEEVRLGLDFTDLVQDVESPRIRKLLDSSLRRDALATAGRWRSNGSELIDSYNVLRSDTLSYSQRRQATTALQYAAQALPVADPPWLLEDLPDPDDLNY